LDQKLLSAKNIHSYDPIQQGHTLILDGQTLVNLEIFQNSFDGGERGTLHKLLNHCVTPFGKRHFRRWLCHPLRQVKAIHARLDAIDDFHRLSGVHSKYYHCLRYALLIHVCWYLCCSLLIYSIFELIYWFFSI
jgi:DNA mismatch repair protein MSH6